MQNPMYVKKGKVPKTMESRGTKRIRKVQLETNEKKSSPVSSVSRVIIITGIIVLSFIGRSVGVIIDIVSTGIEVGGCD